MNPTIYQNTFTLFSDDLDAYNQSDSLLKIELINTHKNAELISNDQAKSMTLKDADGEGETNSNSMNTKGNATKLNVEKRQNSFQATRNFFVNQSGGLIIAPKEYKKARRRGINGALEEQKPEKVKNVHALSNRLAIFIFILKGLLELQQY